MPAVRPHSRVEVASALLSKVDVGSHFPADMFAKWEPSAQLDVLIDAADKLGKLFTHR
jgi:hypothetical protein